MAMRITTKMMQNTSLRNLNINKALQERLTNQMSTGKKITRPSDDPVIAIRSLKLNSSLDKIDQYYEKNASDADSWISLTLSSLSAVNDILTNDVRTNIISANNNYKEAKDREAIVKNLQQAIEEIYSIGNADSAGRTIFTGYRTDMPLSLKADKTEKNVITEQLTNSDINKFIFVRTGDLKSINEGNFRDKDTTEYKVNTEDIYRFRLAYDNVDIAPKLDANGNPVTDADGNVVYESNVDIAFMKDAKVSGNSAVINTSSVTAVVSIDTTVLPNEAVFTIDNQEYRVKKGTSTATPPLPTAVGNVSVSYEDDGTLKMVDNNNVPQETVTLGSSVTKDANGKNIVSLEDKFKTSLAISGYYPTGADDDAYLSVVGDGNANNITYVADTGELLLGANIQKRLSELSSDTELRVTYEKTNWKKNDLDPVHYFYTERTTKGKNGNDRTVKYNENFLSDPSANGRQIIEYDIGNNQSIRVNTTADEVFTHDMGRDMNEVINMLHEYDDLEKCLNTVKNMISSEKYDGEDLTKLEQHQKALEETMTRVGDKIKKRTQELIDDCDGYFARSQMAETDCGARGSRLDLIQNRLEMQQTNFGELVSENEDADYTDLVIQLKSIGMTYEAALSSISYVMQTSLLNFIK